MGTQIEWAEETRNPVTGCTKISPACDHCYAERMAKRHAGRFGYPEAPNTFRVTLHPDRLGQPLRWRKPRRIFVVSMGDLFHPDVPFDYIAAVYGVMAACPQHTFMLLTKRPRRMHDFISWTDLAADHAESMFPLDTLGWRRGAVLKSAAARRGAITDHLEERWPLPNVWVGVTAEDQQRADQRIPLLLQVPAALRFVSCEPLLGPIDLGGVTDDSDNETRRRADVLQRGCGFPGHYGGRRIAWVICGGESGPGARPMHPDWARGLRDQCVEAGVPFLFKSWGHYAPIGQLPGDAWREIDAYGGATERGDEVVGVGKKAAGRELDGRIWDETP